jgi:hypothetical protein
MRGSNFPFFPSRGQAIGPCDSATDRRRCLSETDPDPATVLGPKARRDKAHAGQTVRYCRPDRFPVWCSPIRKAADHPDISGMFVVWDTPAHAVATRLQTEGHSLAIATVDLGEDVAIALATGRSFVSVAAQQPFQQGVAAARTTILALLGRTVPAWIAMPGVAVVRGNVAESFQIIWRKPAPREVLRLIGLAR